MADKETVSTLDTNQIATSDVAGPSTAPNLPSGQNASASNPPDSLYPPQGPDPSGMNPEIGPQRAAEGEAKGKDAPGIEAEQVVWEARYSMKNFIGRVIIRSVLTVAWIALAIYTWGEGHPNASILALLFGIGLGIAWLLLLYRIVVARYAHYYRLTNRRLFVSTGLMRRRRDQMELLHIKDVFTRQTLIDRWLSLGTVVVVSKEKLSPTFYLAGVDDPKRVMDLVWHCARAEREGKTVQLENM
jgi:membrane protein YdbS with pleckstrin-like domain